MDKQVITLIVRGKELFFEVTLESYNKYLNDITMNNKLAPAKNFLMRSVKTESKEDLREILDLPGAAPMLANALQEEFLPDLDIVVGK